MKVIIRWYRKSVYGQENRYVADIGSAQIIAQLTGKKTITSSTMELLRDLTGGVIQWEEVIAPPTATLPHKFSLAY